MFIGIIIITIITIGVVTFYARRCVYSVYTLCYNVAHRTY